MNNEILPFFKKHLCDFLGKKEQAAKYGFGTYELKLYCLAKSGSKTENYAIITQCQWKLEFPNLLPKKETANSTVRSLILLFPCSYITQRLFVR